MRRDLLTGMQLTDVVLVHGLFHQPAHMEALAEVLRREGVTVHIPRRRAGRCTARSPGGGHGRGTVQHAAWKNAPSHHLVCTEDRAVDPQLQRWREPEDAVADVEDSRTGRADHEDGDRHRSRDGHLRPHQPRALPPRDGPPARALGRDASRRGLGTAGTVRRRTQRDTGRSSASIRAAPARRISCRSEPPRRARRRAGPGTAGRDPPRAGS